MAQKDPSDNTLATIASILDHPAEKLDARREDAHGEQANDAGDTLTDADAHSISAVTVEPPQAVSTHPSSDVIDDGTTTIVTETTVARVTSVSVSHTVTSHHSDPHNTESNAFDVASYVRLGPGPLDALRFRWSARKEGQDSYYVDETIGETSRPITTGPFPASEVIPYIDALADEATRRFIELKNEMTLRHSTPQDSSPSFIPSLRNGSSQARVIQHEARTLLG